MTETRLSQLTQLAEDAEAYTEAVNQLRNDLVALDGALDDHRRLVERLERQAANPDDCRCAVQVFATLDGFDGPDKPSSTVCKSCHDRWIEESGLTYRKPRNLMGR